MSRMTGKEDWLRGAAAALPQGWFEPFYDIRRNKNRAIAACGKNVRSHSGYGLDAGAVRRRRARAR